MLYLPVVVFFYVCEVLLILADSL